MKSEIKGLQATGEKVTAELVFLGEQEINLLDLERKIDGKIIAGGKFGKTALAKAIALEAAGIVTADISEELFEEIEHGKTWEIGDECCFKLPLLVIETSSFVGVKDFDGKKVVLDPEEKKLALEEAHD